MLRRSFPPGLAAVVVLSSATVLARDLPNFHVAAKGRALGRVEKPIPLGTPGQVAARDERTGSPTFVWADPTRTSPAVTAALSSRAPVEAIARAHLAEYAAHFGVSGKDLSGLEVHRVHDTGTGSVVVNLAPRVGNLEVFGESVAVVMDRYQQPIAVSGKLYHSRAGEADALLGGFKLAPERVVSAAYRDLVGVDGFSLRPTGKTKGDYQYFELASTGAPERLMSPARAKPMAFRNGKSLEAAYYLELDTRDADGAPHAYAYVVSARTGKVLVRYGLLHRASAFTYRVFADPSGQFRPYGSPYGTAPTPSPTGTPGGTPLPAFVGSNLVTLEHGPISTNDPWLPAGATETHGNNVDAYSDTVPGDGFTALNPGGVPDLRANVTSAGKFDRVYDLSKDPDVSINQTKAAITNLFFLNNWFHDWYYDVGFDEAAGNAQESNYGRTSEELEGDVFHAEADDYSGTDNANMFTPADGASPRQQMYVWHGIQDNHLVINSPAAIAGTVKSGAASFGPQGLNKTANVVAVDEGGQTNGCNAIATSLTGKIALIDRGSCTFVVKVKNAQNAGAVGAIIANTAEGVGTMGGDDATITIGSLMVSKSDGAKIRGASGTVNVTLFRQDPAQVTTLEGAFDGAVVAHEWGHYISHRLLAGGYGFTTQISNGMGEGWADFHALLLIVRPEDAQSPANADWAGTYAVGVYDTAGQSDDPVYFGIRRYPYSTDMSKNPLTFKHIMEGQPLPVGPPVQTGLASPDNAELHNVGEVWATMLWECYASLLRAHPFQEAQDRMRAYIVAAYKATPPGPTMLEARDALLAVVAARDGDDYQRFGQAFAKRGLGTGAVAPDRFDATNGQQSQLVESYAWGPDITIEGASFADGARSCDGDGVLDRGEEGMLSIVLGNRGKDSLSRTSVTVRTITQGVSIADGGVFSVPEIPAGTTAAIQVPVSLAVGSNPGPRTLDVSVTVADPDVDAGVASTRTLSGTASVRIDTDDVPGARAVDDMEGTTTAWTTRSARASNNPWVRIGFDPTHNFWYAEEPDRASDESLISPPLQVGTGALIITFNASWWEESDGTTAYDGVVMEVSEDDGATWTDVIAAGGTLNPGYNVTLDDGGPQAPGVANPLQGRQAWGDANAAALAANYFPTFERVTLNLGTLYAGKTIRVRLRSGSDSGAFAVGFLMDDFAVNGITNTPFVRLVSDRPKCVPTADAGVAFTIDERTPGMLSGSYVQAQGTPPTLHWEQKTGPAFVLSDPGASQPTFVAPDVPADATATFTFTATGIQGSSSSDLTITIKDVNRPPTAQITGGSGVKTGGVAALSGAGSTDPDGDPLTYAWTQTGGAHVTLEGADTANVRFTAPGAAGKVELQLKVTDAKGASAVAATTVDVQGAGGCSTSGGGSPVPALSLVALGLMLLARRGSSGASGRSAPTQASGRV